MNRILSALVVSLAICSSAFAQRAVIIQLPSGQLLGVAYTPAGQVVLTDVTIIKLAPTPNPTTGLASQLIVLRDQTSTSTKKVAVLLDLQEKYQRGTKPEMFLLDKTDPSNLTKSYVALKPTTAAFPYYFLVEKGGRILAQGELPDTTEAAVSIIAKYQEPK